MRKPVVVNDKRVKALYLISAVLFFIWQASFAFAEYPIAGVNPDKRPKGAPKITSLEREANWYDKALQGVEAPYPPSLRFLDNQGNWYTPFTRPGMRGPYDIRQWHPKEARSEKKKKSSWWPF